MSNANASKTAITILATLEEDPKTNFFPWEIAVIDAAASRCKTLTPRGLLSALLTVEQWNTYPANLSVDGNGQQVIAPRYAPPIYVEPANTMSSVELYVAKSTNDQLLEWTTAEEALKTAIMESLGPVVRQIVKHPLHGFTLLSIQDIMASVRSRYGKMRKNTRKNLEEKMSSRLASTDSFETHVSHLREQFLTFEKGGHQILEEKRVDILRKSLSGHSILEKILNQYDFKNCDDTLWTFDDIVEFIDDHLPNLQSSAQIAAEDHANVMTSVAYVALEAEIKKLKASLPTPKKRQGGKGKGKNKKIKKNRTNGNESSTTRTDTLTDKPTKYCHAHGSQNTHWSSECKLMAADKTTFTAAMRNAKDSEHPPGGSTKVLGQRQ